MKLVYPLFLFALLFLSNNRLFAQERVKINDDRYLEVSKNGTISLFNKNDIKISEGAMSVGKRVGTWTFYDEATGRKKAIETYKNGKLHGIAEYYYPNGVKRLYGEYKNGERSGIWKSSSTSGNIYEVISFEQGKANGIATYYDTVTNKIIGEGKHKNGKRTGQWYFYANLSGKVYGAEYYENGLMEGPASYYDTLVDCNDKFCGKETEGDYLHNLRTGIWTFFYPETGTIRAKETYKDSMLNGKAWYYTKGGVLSQQREYDNGIETGERITYDTLSGRVFSKAQVSEGGKKLEIKYFFDDDRGMVSFILNINDDMQNGPKQYFDSLTGIIYQTYYYEDDSMTSLCYYDTLGRLSDSTHWTNGYIRYLVCYDTECNVKKNESFYKDEKTKDYALFYYECSDRIKSRMDYYENDSMARNSYYDSISQTVYLEGDNLNGSWEGIWTKYYTPSKTVQAKLPFKHGVLDGTASYFDSATGSLVADGEFVKGNRDGEWKRFYKNGKLLSAEHYKDGELDGPAIVYDSIGNEYMTFSFKAGKRDGKSLFNYYGTSNRWIELNHEKDIIDGKLTSYYPGGRLKRKESYRNGTLIKSECFAENGDEIEYYPLFVKEEFQEDVMNYIGKELRYPQKARAEKREGRVVVRFNIEETGRVANAEIVKSAGSDLDEEALRIISHMPPWTPQYVDGIPVKTYKSLPIVFWLQE